MSRLWTPMSHFCGRRAIFERFKLGIIGLLCAFLLSSCGESSPRGYGSSSSSDTLSPISAPPGSGQSPALPGTTGAPKTPEGLPALSSKGLNTALFSTKLDSEDARINRLENAVQEMRNDFDAMSPAIVRLISVEKDIQSLISQLEVLTNGSPIATPVPPIDESLLDEQEPVQPAPAPLPAIPSESPAANNGAIDILPPVADIQKPHQAAVANPPPATATPPVSPDSTQKAAQTQNTSVPSATTEKPMAAQSTVSVTGVRLGEHKGKVRLVLDISGKTNFTADLDSSEKILIVEMPKTGWNAQPQKAFASNPILLSYKTEKNGDGTRLIIQIKVASEILYKSTLANPDGTSRIVLDLKSP